MNNLKRAVSILMTLALLFSLAIPVMAEEKVAAIEPLVTDLGGGLYQVEVILHDALDLAGLSIDLQIDDTVLEPVDQAGNPTLAPFVRGDVFNGVSGNLVVVNKVDAGRLSYVHLLLGRTAGNGVDYSGDISLASLYLKVKEGQTFDGFDTLKVADTFDLLSPDTICVKLSDAGVLPILYATYRAEIIALIGLSEAAGTMNGSYPVTMTITYPLNIVDTLTATVDMTIGQGEITFHLPSDYEVGTTLEAHIDGYATEVIVINAKEAYKDVSLATTAYAGDQSGDNKINDQDLMTLSTLLGETKDQTGTDYNGDGVFNLQDLFHTAKNFGKGVK